MTGAAIRDPGPEATAEAVRVLGDGGIVLVPSDANYGVAVDPFNAQAVASCFAIKGRPGTKPLTLFIAEPGDWAKFGRVGKPSMMSRLAEAFWPGPLNIVIDKSANSPDLSMVEDETISIACHANPILRDVTKAFGGAIAMTSANLAGRADGMLVDLSTAMDQLGASVKLAIRSGPAKATKSTTILRLSDQVSLIREGDLTMDEVRAALA